MWTGLDFGEVFMVGCGLELLERGLLGGVGAQGVLVGVVGGDPESVTEGLGVVVLRAEWTAPSPRLVLLSAA